MVQLVSRDRIRVMRGLVKVEVAEGAEGFAVETTFAEVIDLGTVFSVAVSEGNADVVVFDGAVDLNVAAPLESGQPEGVRKRFRAGEAVQVADDGTLSRISNVQQSTLGSDDDDLAAQSTIGLVKDNNVRDDFWSFYEIVRGGMEEDTVAFVDRRHQWNGRRQTGMPDYLVGGDYVKTFNDDKVTDELRISVSLNRPACLYVLLDQRVAPPDWLLESFEDTGDVIGVDESPYSPGDPEKVIPGRLAWGPGRSIDRVHSIWKRMVPEGGEVILGANGRPGGNGQAGLATEANMYGIVAVPIHEPAADSSPGWRSNEQRTGCRPFRIARTVIWHALAGRTEPLLVADGLTAGWHSGELPWRAYCGQGWRCFVSIACR